MNVIYAIGVRGYSFLIRIASLWNNKAKKWMQGRKNVFAQLDAWNRKELPLYWFHCASLGEFEQGRPLIELLKEKEDCQIILTFFSPSGYEIRKDYEYADLVIYLPKETKKNVTRFLDKIQPDLVFFIKYEFWATYLFEAKKRGAKLYSVSAVFRKKHIFFKWYGGFMQRVLKSFDLIFVQDKNSQILLNQIGINSVVAGDTRYDRVMANAHKVVSYPDIERFIGEKKVFVIGSSWTEDEKIIADTINSNSFNWKIIIAPHEIGEDRIKAIENKFKKKSIRYSIIKNKESTVSDILIVDNIGMLMNVYQYADIAYVGGAFGKGLHNILEPASFGVPVIFGHNYSKFNEAVDFVDQKIGFSVNDSESFNRAFYNLAENNLKNEVNKVMKSKIGATQKIMELVKG